MNSNASATGIGRAAPILPRNPTDCGLSGRLGGEVTYNEKSKKPNYHEGKRVLTVKNVTNKVTFLRFWHIF